MSGFFSILCTVPPPPMLGYINTLFSICTETYFIMYIYILYKFDLVYIGLKKTKSKIKHAYFDKPMTAL